MQPAKILVADDEQNLRRVLVALLRREGHEVVQAASGLEAIERLTDVDVVITDLRMPGADGMEVLRTATKNHPHVPVIMITAYGSVGQAVEAIKAGAFDYIEKPFEQDSIRTIITKAIGQAAANRNAPRATLYPTGEALPSGRFGLVGTSDQMQTIFKVIEQVADTPSTVLITGESGTGKELVAKALHEQSSRKGEPFIKINCAAIPKDLLESELFGYKKGAFTGANTDKIGLLEMAEGGALMLDEIGEMPPFLQTKLLRVLQEREYRPIGSDRFVKVDFRLICATNIDLDAALADGRLREDLYFRINTIQLRVPPLRERTEDIPLLCDWFVEKFARRHQKSVRGVSAAAYHLLIRSRWPGNVRELENAMERAVLVTRTSELQPGDLPDSIRAGGADDAFVIPPHRTLAEIERMAIVQTLERTNWNKQEAAQILGLYRPTLYNKMRRHGITGRGERRRAAVPAVGEA